MENQRGRDRSVEDLAVGSHPYCGESLKPERKIEICIGKVIRPSISPASRCRGIARSRKVKTSDSNPGGLCHIGKSARLKSMGSRRSPIELRPANGCNAESRDRGERYSLSFGHRRHPTFILECRDPHDGRERSFSFLAKEMSKSLSTGPRQQLLSLSQNEEPIQKLVRSLPMGYRRRSSRSS